MASHKKQHFIPETYLKAWCDPKTPPGQTPYVWLFSKDGSQAKKKAPVNILHEKDAYTIVENDGGRNLVLEHGLAELESRFALIRDAKLNRQQTLSSEERFVLCAFAAAMHARTKARRNHHAEQWGKVVAMAERLKEKAKTFTEEEREQARQRAETENALRPSNRLSYGEQEVRLMASEPFQHLLAPEINALTPVLYSLDVAVLAAGPSNAFITSDNPCVWFDPEAYKRPPMFQSPALQYESTEIRLPISPEQLVVFKRKLGNIKGFIRITDQFTDELNRVTRFSSHEYFISHSDRKKDIWFDPGIEPDDSWSKTHSKSNKN